MAFDRKTWFDYESGATPTDADALNDLEGRIESAVDLFAPPEGIDVNVKDFGAVGDGVADDTAEFQAAADTGEPRIYMPAGTFKLSAGINWQDGQEVHGAGPGRTIITGDAPSSSGLFNIVGSLGTSKTLTANAVLQGNTLTMASTTGIVAGDYVLITSGAQFDSRESGARAGEIRQVQSVTSTVLTLWGHLDDSYNTADTAIVRKINQKVNNTFRDFTIRQNVGNLSWGIYADYTRGLLIDRVACDGDRYNGSRLTVRTSLNFWINRPWFGGGYTDADGASPLGYGVNAVSSQDGIVSNGFARRGHGSLFTTNGRTDGNGGVPRHILVANSIAADNYTSPLFTHESAEYIGFHDCKIYGRNTSYSVIDGHPVGIGMFGKRGEIVDCKVEGITGAGIKVAAAGARVEGNTVRMAQTGAGDSGIGIWLNNQSDTTYVDDNRLIDCEFAGIYQQGVKGRFSNNRTVNCPVGIRYNTSDDTSEITDLVTDDATTAAIYFDAPASPRPSQARRVTPLGSTALVCNKPRVVAPFGPWNQVGQLMVDPLGTVVVANSIYGQVVHLPDGADVTGVRFRVGTATGNMQAAIYTADGGTRLGTTASTAVATGVMSVPFSSALCLKPGTYIVVLQFSAAASPFAVAASNQLGPSLTGTAGSFTLPTTVTPPSVTSTATAAINIPTQLY